MVSANRRLRLGIIGCGAIGSRIAISTQKELKTRFMVAALYDIDIQRSTALARKLNKPSLAKQTLLQAIQASDIIVEAVNSSTKDIVRQTLKMKKNVVVMSVGRLLDESSLFLLADRNRVSVLIPSGAIAGLDAIKAARLAGIKSATLTTTKPLTGFQGNAYIQEKGIDLKNAKKDIVLFEGSVAQAVRFFPQNINVAAVLSLAVGDSKKVKVKIVASPKAKRNTHEIVVEGACGRIVTKVENEICPDNPKTSYLAVLSAIQILKQFASNVKIGT